MKSGILTTDFRISTCPSALLRRAPTGARQLSQDVDVLFHSGFDVGNGLSEIALAQVAQDRSPCAEVIADHLHSGAQGIGKKLHHAAC